MRVRTPESVRTLHLHQHPGQLSTQVSPDLKPRLRPQRYAQVYPQKHLQDWTGAGRKRQGCSLKREKFCGVSGAPRTMKTPLRIQLPATCFDGVGKPRGVLSPEALEPPELGSSSSVRTVSHPVPRRVRKQQEAWVMTQSASWFYLL